MDDWRRTRSLRVGAMLVVLALSLAACNDDLAPPFSIEGTGGVEGLVYFDLSEDGVYDPADGDYAVEGVRVAVQDRGTGQTFSGATARSGQDGRFMIGGLPAGTHDLMVDESSVDEGVNICQNPLQVTVYLTETRFAPVRTRPGCLITIAEAQELPAGEFVVIRGIVTSFPGQFDEGDAAIQDETGGIWLLAGNLTGEGLQVGDQIEVGGVLNLDVEAVQLQDVQLRGTVPDVGVPDPTLLTTGEVAAASDARDSLQNLLVTVEAAKLLSGFTSGGDRNANIDDGSGPTVLRVESVLSPDAGDGILSTLGIDIGKCYDITGIVGAYFGLAELFPRTSEDFVEVPCT